MSFQLFEQRSNRHSRSSRVSLYVVCVLRPQIKMLTGIRRTPRRLVVMQKRSRKQKKLMQQVRRLLLKDHEGPETGVQYD